MLENLTNRIGNILRIVSGKYKISDSDIKTLLKDFRKTLLDADVSWSVVKHITEGIRNKLLDIEITRKVSPKDIFVKIVIDEFLTILNLNSISNYDDLFNKKGFNTILFAGLHGVGKTTSLVKLANLIKYKNNKSVLVVSCDVYRPAAIDQLKILSSSVNIDCFLDFKLTDDPELIVNKAVNYARAKHYDFLIVDSAGRSHIDDIMMTDLVKIYNVCNPIFSFLVIDSIVGQDGVKSASVFCDRIDISGFFLTKMDSDAKGGVLLSLSFLTKKPIFFIGVGEKISDISYFYPDRIVSRILGFGDIHSLVEDINEKIKDDSSINLKEDQVFCDFKLDDFKNQLIYIIKLGGFENLVEKIPGGYTIDKSLLDKFDNKFFLKMIAIINSMTVKERTFPSLINGSRKKRISSGAGVNVHDISKMLKYYDKMKKLFIKCGSNKSFLESLKNKFF